jgi:hypothetical protein
LQYFLRGKLLDRLTSFLRRSDVLKLDKVGRAGDLAMRRVCATLTTRIASPHPQSTLRIDTTSVVLTYLELLDVYTITVSLMEILTYVSEESLISSPHMVESPSIF